MTAKRIDPFPKGIAPADPPKSFEKPDIVISEDRIMFIEGTQRFVCEEYYMHNFSAFVHANAVYVNSPERLDSNGAPITKQLFFLELTQSQPIRQEKGDELARRFLAADDQVM